MARDQQAQTTEVRSRRSATEPLEALRASDAEVLRSIGERIHMTKVAREMTQHDLARAVGVTRAAISQWESGDAEAGLTKLARAAEAMRCDLGFLISGSAAPMPQAMIGKRPGNERRRENGRPVEGVIAEMESGIGSGGAYHRAGLQADWWRLPAAVLAGFGAKAETVQIFRVTAASMEPTIARGSFVAVDFAQTRIHDGQVYAIDNGISLVIKRLYLKAGSGAPVVEMVSDQDRERRTELPLAKVKIAGRLIAQMATAL